MSTKKSQNRRIEMGEAYSEDLRQRILRAIDKGLPVRQVYGLYEVSTYFIYKALIRRHTRGETGARPRGGRVAKKRVDHHETLLEQVRLESDITLSELQGRVLKSLYLGNVVKDGVAQPKKCPTSEWRGWFEVSV
jgi:hypothetical protein